MWCYVLHSITYFKCNLKQDRLCFHIITNSFFFFLPYEHNNSISIVDLLSSPLQTSQVSLRFWKSPANQYIISSKLDFFFSACHKHSITWSWVQNLCQRIIRRWSMSNLSALMKHRGIRMTPYKVIWVLERLRGLSAVYHPSESPKNQFF